MIKLVALDFDDTLAMTEEATFQMENETARRMGYPPMTREAHKKNWGKPLEEAIVERFPGINPEEFMRKLYEAHQRYITEGKIDVISDENLRFLDKLLESGKKLAILTSRSFQEVEHLLSKDHHLAKRIDKFYHKDNSEFLKPDPRVFAKMLSDFAVSPRETVYLGDAITDAIAAKSANLHFIAILESGIRTKEDFAPYAVDFFATSLPEAYNYIINQ